LATITLRQDVVAELTEKSEIFYNLGAVIKRFLDIDHLLSLCVQVPKQENIKTAENKITNMLYLKHTLELVAPLREALANCENPLLKTSYKVLCFVNFLLYIYGFYYMGEQFRSIVASTSVLSNQDLHYLLLGQK
jgi:DNA mismatch repair protein MSH4